MHYQVRKLPEFIIFLCLFVIPALFQQEQHSVSAMEYNASSLTTIAVYSLFLTYLAVQYLRTRKNVSDTGEPESSGQNTVSSGQSCPEWKNALRYVFITLALFLSLLINEHIWTRISSLLTGADQAPELTVSQKTPDVLISILSVLILAIFEEFLFRWYIPVQLRSFLPLIFRNNEKTSRTSRIAAEILSVLVFASVHRYMGWWAAGHALTAGILLRISLVYGGSIIPGLIAHTLLNLNVFFGILLL